MTVNEHDLVEHCRARLASYKKPRSVRFVASLPRSHYGKVLRAQLVEQANSEWRIANGEWRLAADIRYSPFAIRSFAS